VYVVNKTKEYRFGPGDVFLFSCNEDHVVTSVYPRVGTDSLCIHFKPRFVWSPGNELFDVKYLQSFYDRDKNFDHHLPADLEVTKAVSTIMCQMEREFENRMPEYELIVKIELLTILVELNRHFQRAPNTEARLAVSDQNMCNIEKSMQYIDENVGADIKLGQLAQIAAMSKSHYTRQFKTLNGITPWEYLVSRRIELAQERLLRTDTSVLEIANICGFHNSANFNRSFRQCTGMTPTQFRKEALGGNGYGADAGGLRALGRIADDVAVDYNTPSASPKAMQAALPANGYRNMAAAFESVMARRRSV